MSPSRPTNNKKIFQSFPTSSIIDLLIFPYVLNPVNKTEIAFNNNRTVF